jgi:glycosyltransferase involved in cell wall biosynthesis
MISKFKEFQGGVERHIYDLMEELRHRGHVIEFFASDDLDEDSAKFSATASGFDRVRSAKSLLWNSRARREVQRIVDTFKPDLIHYHSIYHHLSPSVLRVANLPTVMTLHDYKLAAPCYSLYRDGEVCKECVGKLVATPSIRYRCVSNSAAASTLCAIEGALYRNRYNSEVSRFIVPSRFAYDVAIGAGLPPGAVSIVPWGVRSKKRQNTRRGKVAFYGGRLHPNKGVGVVLEAWRQLPPGHGCELRVAGEGELEGQVRHLASGDSTVQFLGMLSSDKVMDEISSATVAIMPSLVPETMGLFAIEALVSGTPLICSQRGALADFSGKGVWSLPRVDSRAISEALDCLLLRGGAAKFAEELVVRDLSLYDADRMVSAIEDVYRKARFEKRSSAD